MEHETTPGARPTRTKTRRLMKVLFTMVPICALTLAFTSYAADGGDLFLDIFYSSILAFIFIPVLISIYYFLTFLAGSFAFGRSLIARIILGLMSTEILLFAYYTIENYSSEDDQFLPVYFSDWRPHLACFFIGALMGVLDVLYQKAVERKRKKQPS